MGTAGAIIVVDGVLEKKKLVVIGVIVLEVL